MHFDQPLQQGKLIRRYKRFLADIELSNGEQLTIHCPNTGSMKNCQEAGARVWFTDSGNEKRKYPCTWQFIEIDSRYLVGINTNLANKLAVEAIAQGWIAALDSYTSLATEVPYGEQRSRIDILLDNPEKENSVPCYIEVKNVSLYIEQGLGIFPDSVTARGQKHLQELMHMKSKGCRAVLLFCVQHQAIQRVSPADDIDPEYSRLLRLAVDRGVEVLVWGVNFDVDNHSIELSRELALVL